MPMPPGSFFRRFATPAVALVAALTAVAPAAAKQTQVTVSAPAAAPTANVAWAVTVHVRLRGKPFPKQAYRPTVYVLDRSGMPVATFHGTRVAPGLYRVGVVFSGPGRWRYVIPDPVNGEWRFVSPAVHR